jgi:hypothetical protein
MQPTTLSSAFMYLLTAVLSGSEKGAVPGSYWKQKLGVIHSFSFSISISS